MRQNKTLKNVHQGVVTTEGRRGRTEKGRD